MPNPYPLKRLKIVFDAPISPKQIAAFRGAVVNMVGREDSLLFHNHLDTKQFRYGYPLIQYKHIQHKPCIVCVGDGVGEIHKFFQQENWDISLNGEQMQLRVADLQLKELKLKTTSNPLTYRIHQWAALNDRVKKDYERLDNLAERLQLLEQVLGGNIISMAKGIGWQVPERVTCKIQHLGNEFFMPIKHTSKRVFNLSFSTHVHLPNYIGLGRHTSLGFGTIQQINTQSKKQLVHPNLSFA